MAYQTGVTSSLLDLINTLFTFAESNGFTRGPTGSSGTNPVYDNYSLVKNGIYYTFQIPRTGTVFLYMNTAEAFTGSAWSLNNPGSLRIAQIAGPHVGYHFFADQYAIHVVVEIVTNVFVHFNFGEIKKNGTWKGGQFITGLTWFDGVYERLHWSSSYVSTPFDTYSIGSSSTTSQDIKGHVRCQLSPQATSGISTSITDGRCWFSAMADNYGRTLVNRSPNSMNGRAVLVPLNLIHGSTQNNGPYYQLGHVTNAAVVNIRNLNPKEVVNGDWMVFPMSQKNGPATTYINSGNYGMAYKR